MPQDDKKHISTTTGLLIILAAAVIIGGGAIAYFYAMSPTSWDFMGNRASVHKTSNTNTNTSNTNSTTADWKTYTNGSNWDFQYSFKYPNTYTATLPSSELDGGAHLSLNDTDNKVFILSLLTGTKDQAIASYGDIDNKFFSKISKTETVDVGNIQATKISGTFDQLGKEGGMGKEGVTGSAIILSANHRTYLLVSSDNGDKTLQSNLSSILSTFQFTK